ncbi:MAG: hypothetical protein IT442_10490 [Phycisphaeraceae bacterium]|nr:hypothetical protein [Phycisphaeraceae bacterium]
MLSFRTYFCPVTGRGLESRDCVVRRWRAFSPYADVPVLLSGWTFLAAGSIAFLVIGINLCDSALAFGASVGITLSVLAMMRFVQQIRAYRRHQKKGQITANPKSTDTPGDPAPTPQDPA